MRKFGLCARCALPLFTVVLLLVSGCGFLKKKGGDDAGSAAPADTAAAEAVDAAAAPAAAAAAASVKKANAAIGIPSHDDHQAKAAVEITKSNYKDELDKIEKENKK
ncbi:MAG: hypothetical protein ABIP39_03405 [Polyangiaceae bacterium]